jgi:hypothetical protein
MLDFLRSEIFNCREDSPIKTWLRVKCDIEYFGKGKKRELTLQIKPQGDKFISNINIEEYPFQNKLKEIVILPSSKTSDQHHVDDSLADIHTNPKYNNDESIATLSKKPRIQEELIIDSPIVMDIDVRNDRDVSTISPRKKSQNDEELINNTPADRIAKIQHSQVTGKD